jgi:hypothetical protein
MKRSTDTLHFITPESEGWAVWRGTQRLHIGPTLEDAVRLLPPAAPFVFALPCHPLILERLHLPAAERDELAEMVHLQWEKALPYPPEEITGGFALVESSSEGAVVWSVAASRDAFRPFADAWSQASRWPERTAPYVCHVATACPAGETVLVIYGEQGHYVVAVVENRRPGWVHVMSASDPAGFAAEFPSLMLTAGLDGVPTNFARIFLSPEFTECRPAVEATAVGPIESLPLVTPTSNLEMNLFPAEWRGAAEQKRRGAAWRRRALAAAAVALVFAVLAAVDLFRLQHRVSQLEAELNSQRPALAVLQSRQARFHSLAPAIDAHHYAIEILYLLQRCLPADTVRFTEFEQMPDQWRVVGEAPNPALAIDYLSKLKHDPELSAGDISADPPQMLANERAQFQVIGKP